MGASGFFDKAKGLIRENLPDAVTNEEISGQSNEMLYCHKNRGLITGSKLIVREGQEAIYMRNGIIVSIYTPGYYELETDNKPIAKTILTKIYDGNPNASEIWFVNKASMMSIPWGTANPIPLEETRFGEPIILHARCNGDITLKITNSYKLFTEMAGAGQQFTIENFKRSTQGIVQSRLHKIISNLQRQSKKGFLDLQYNIHSIEDPLKDAINLELERFGLVIELCNVKMFTIADDENWELYQDLQRRSLTNRVEVTADLDRQERLSYSDIDITATRQAKLGYDYVTGRQLDVLETAAGNAGNPLMNMAAGGALGLGVGAAIGRSFADPVSSAITPPPGAPAQAAKNCPGCNTRYDEGTKFCPECGMLVKKLCLSCQTPVDGQKFCPECGKKILICRRCGSDTEVGANSCHRCGEGLSAGVTCGGCGKTYDQALKFCAECGYRFA